MHENWNAEKALDEIKHGGRIGANRVRVAVYRDNVDVFRQWGYTLPDGTFVGLGDRDALLSGTKVYARPFDVNDVLSCGGETRTGCVNADCVDVAETLIADGFKPAILNLASRRKPGGGYEKGMGAQEETLCRLSTLSQSLYQYYDPTRRCVQDAVFLWRRHSGGAELPRA